MQKFNDNFELLRSQNANDLHIVVINLNLVIVVEIQFIKKINSSDAYLIDM
jgi:hypothetical protein